MTDQSKQYFLDIPFAKLDFSESLLAIEQMARSDDFSFVVTPNVDHVVSLYPKKLQPVTRRFREAYHAANLVLCDSRVIQRLARFSNIALPIIPGSDLTVCLFKDQLGKGDRVAIVGGNAQLMADLQAIHPDPVYIHHDPPMGILTNPGAMEAIVDFVAQAQADYVFLGIGSPQSEIIAHECLKSGRCRGVALCIGASLEFITAVKARAPDWMQRAGLEWAFRLLSEPTRLWRRYLVKGPRVFRIYWKMR